MSRKVKLSEIREASPRVRELALAGLIAEARAPADIEAMDAEIAEYEERYGLDSNQLRNELSSGEREETEEILSWLMLLHLRERVERAT